MRIFDPLLSDEFGMESARELCEGTERAYWKEKGVTLGQGTKVWHKDKVNLYGCAIGRDCNIGAFVEIGRGVQIGDRVRIGAFTFIPEGVTIEDDVFIGPRVTFCNDPYPPGGKEAWRPILVKRHAALGAASVILPGVVIGENALIAAGTIVARNIPASMMVRGCSRKFIKEGQVWNQIK